MNARYNFANTVWNWCFDGWNENWRYITIFMG